MRFGYTAYTRLGKQTLGGHTQNLVCTRTQDKGAVTPQETDPDLPVSVQESLAEAWVDSGLLRGRGTECPRPCSRPLPTHACARDSWALTGKSGSVSFGVTAPFSWVLVHTRFCFCSKSLFLQFCVSSVFKSHSPPKSNALGVLPDPQVGKAVVGPRTFSTV